MKNKLALTALVVIAATGQAVAQGAPSPIEIRQTAFDLMSGDFGGINAVVAAKGDTKPLEARAKAIARYAALIPALFPPGSNVGENTKALPEVWSDRAGFEKAAANLGAAASKLADSAKGGDLELVAVDVKAVSGACGACHKEYRAK